MVLSASLFSAQRRRVAAEPLAASTAGHTQRARLDVAAEQRRDHFFHGAADMRDNSNSGRCKRSLQGLRNYAANEKIDSQSWKQLRAFKGVSRDQRFLLAMLFQLFGHV
jgi:hypothetical protein